VIVRCAAGRFPRHLTQSTSNRAVGAKSEAAGHPLGTGHSLLTDATVLLLELAVELTSGCVSTLTLREGVGRFVR
jgi:hypothetical protein